MQNFYLKAVTWLQKHKFSWYVEEDGRIVLIDNRAPSDVREYINEQNRMYVATDVVRKFDWDTDSRFGSGDISDKARYSYDDCHTLGLW